MAPGPAGSECRLLFFWCFPSCVPDSLFEEKRLLAFHDYCPLFLQDPVPLPSGRPPWFLGLSQLSYSRPAALSTTEMPESHD